MKIISKLHKKLDPMGWAIKNGMRVGKGCVLIAKQRVSFGSEPYLITLGDEVKISAGVSFITHDGGTWAFRDLPKYKDVVKFGPIKVGKRSFIGMGSIIMPGVTIGERCVVASGSIVTKDIPDNTVVAGVPARPIKTTQEYAEKCLSAWEQKGYNPKEYKQNKKAYLEKLLLKE